MYKSISFLQYKYFQRLLPKKTIKSSFPINLKLSLYIIVLLRYIQIPYIKGFMQILLQILLCNL